MATSALGTSLWEGFSLNDFPESLENDLVQLAKSALGTWLRGFALNDILEMCLLLVTTSLHQLVIVHQD